MSCFGDVSSFESLYAAHLLSRRGKQGREEVARFELDLGCNLARLSQELEEGSYRMGPYARFVVTDPKRREIHAPRYRDRVVQRSLCDNALAPVLEPRLIYDNAACRRGKGTRFALERLKGFLREHWRHHGCDGWVLKCDIARYFASVRHDVLLGKLGRLPFDAATMCLVRQVVESYATAPGRGLPLGNQTSQWFALYYLDVVDRLIKERMHVRGYVRYMDDMVLVHPSRAHLRSCLAVLGRSLAELGLRLNGKTQLQPLDQGVDYLGWHLRLDCAGRVGCRLRSSSKLRLRARLRASRVLPAWEEEQVRQSCAAYLAFGDTAGLRRALGLG
jgi:RNA-directed DNA polymerase